MTSIREVTKDNEGGHMKQSYPKASHSPNQNQPFPGRLHPRGTSQHGLNSSTELALGFKNVSWAGALVRRGGNLPRTWLTQVQFLALDMVS